MSEHSLYFGTCWLNDPQSYHFLWEPFAGKFAANISLSNKTPLFDAQFPTIVGYRVQQIMLNHKFSLFIYFFFQYMSIEKETHGSNDQTHLIDFNNNNSANNNGTTTTIITTAAAATENDNNKSSKHDNNAHNDDN